MIGDQFVGPVEFPNTLTVQHYLHFLQSRVTILVGRRSSCYQTRYVLQQDGGLPHFSRTPNNLREGPYSIRDYGNVITSFEETGSVADKKKCGRQGVIADAIAAEVFETSDNASEMSPGSSTESYPAFARIGLKENPGKKPQPDNLPQPGFGQTLTGHLEMSPGSSTESYPAFARIGLKENPGKNLNQITCPNHLDALTVTPQAKPSTRSSYLLAWPPNSPDLTPPDFFVWGFIKDKLRDIDDMRVSVGTTNNLICRIWQLAVFMASGKESKMPRNDNCNGGISYWKQVKFCTHDGFKRQMTQNLAIFYDNKKKFSNLAKERNNIGVLFSLPTELPMPLLPVNEIFYLCQLWQFNLEIATFLREEDDEFLVQKVVLIIGLAGACRREELTNLIVENVKDEGQCVRFFLPITKPRLQGSFFVTSGDVDGVDILGIVRKYIQLCPEEANHLRKTNIGKNEEMIARVAQEIRRDRRQSIDDVTTLLGISHVSVQSILHLKMQRVCEHVVPRSLTDEQREERQLGLVHFEFIPEGRPVSKETYVEFFGVFVLQFDERPNLWQELSSPS
ncbi:hypothetical protein ANN_02606 [Periplaneta americana]|uniref:Uncharacterized protein n=1 Tax=Periplaneta americana TaxID=6978 RepID=A0ABQ8TWV2_PERAM|nr:hypothetical protein ANN_02606 [Periplaneta americana]